MHPTYIHNSTQHQKIYIKMTFSFISVSGRSQFNSVDEQWTVWISEATVKTLGA